MYPRSPLRSILIVEDDPFDVSLLINALACLQVEPGVITCDDGIEAINWLRGSCDQRATGRSPAPGLVLIGLVLPGIDGVGVISWIRRQPRLANVPVVAVSGAADPAEISRAFAAGADDVIAKPATPLVLQRLLMEFGWGPATDATRPQSFP